MMRLVCECGNTRWITKRTQRDELAAWIEQHLEHFGVIHSEEHPPINLGVIA